MNKIEKLTGAGVVPIFDNREGIFSDLKKEILYLILHDKKGRYDFPKGCIDLRYGEQPYDCAVREMFEECNLSLNDFVDEKLSGNSSQEGFMCGDRLLMFFGIVKNISNIKVKPNPEIKEKNGIDYYEHSGFSWLPYEEAIAVNKEINKSMLRNFLVPALQQAKIWANKNI
jgi:8-oxo-dGTP pyrophosphatase MutT (NUDIX family)